MVEQLPLVTHCVLRIPKGRHARVASLLVSIVSTAEADPFTRLRPTLILSKSTFKEKFIVHSYISLNFKFDYYIF